MKGSEEKYQRGVPSAAAGIVFKYRRKLSLDNR